MLLLSTILHYVPCPVSGILSQTLAGSFVFLTFKHWSSFSSPSSFTPLMISGSPQTFKNYLHTDDPQHDIPVPATSLGLCLSHATVSSLPALRCLSHLQLNMIKAKFMIPVPPPPPKCSLPACSSFQYMTTPFYKLSRQNREVIPCLTIHTSHPTYQQIL